MMKLLRSVFVICGLFVIALSTNVSVASAQTCAAGPATVQILGSGGPRFTTNRASTSYLLWIGGKARMLVDMGSGSYLRFGQSGAKLSDLALIGISHLHPDHVSDLAGLLWQSHAYRKEALPIFGPSSGTGLKAKRGHDFAPDFQTFLTRMFHVETGAFPIMARTLGTKQGNGVRLKVGVLDVLKKSPMQVFEANDLKVTALGIPHGNMPTLAYRVETSDGSVVFSSDQNGSDLGFVDFAKNANVLIMHMAKPIGTKHPFHAAPNVIGRIAQAAQVGRLIVSHIVPKGDMLKAAIAEVKKYYKGPLTVGADLQCTPVAG